jgi:hypothetical protein
LLLNKGIESLTNSKTFKVVFEIEKKIDETLKWLSLLGDG